MTPDQIAALREKAQILKSGRHIQPNSPDRCDFGANEGLSHKPTTSFWWTCEKHHRQVPICDYCARRFQCPDCAGVTVSPDVLLSLLSDLARLQEENEKLRRLRQHAGTAYEILEGLRLSVEWEIAPSIMAFIARTQPELFAALDATKPSEAQP